MEQKTMLHHLMNPTYKNEKTNESIKIFKRTKKKRVKDKHFIRILKGATEEKGVVEYKGAVLMKYNLWIDLNNQIVEEEKKLQEYTKIKEKLENKMKEKEATE